MAYVKKEWKVEGFQKGDDDFVAGLNHLEEGVAEASAETVNYVRSCSGAAGGKPIPYGQGVGGPDSAFPNYNFVLGGCYQCAGDTLTDWMRPIVMGNNPNTVEQSFKYSIPIRDGHGRMFTYCGTQSYQALLDAEVCNVAATKYLINQKIKRISLDFERDDIGDIPEGENKRRMLTDSGKAKAAAFFNKVDALKNIIKLAFIPKDTGGVAVCTGMFAYVTTGYLTEEHLQFMVNNGLFDETSADVEFVVYYLTREWIKGNNAQRIFALHPGFKIEITYVEHESE